MAVRPRGGRYMIDVRHHDPDGRVERVRIAAPPHVNSMRAAEAFERAVLTDLRAGIDPRRGRKEERQDAPREVPTFAAFVQEYLRDYANAHNKPSTLESKRSIFDQHLVPTVGHLRLDQIGQKEIDRLKAAKLQDLSAKTVNNMLTVLRSTLDVAAQWGIIPAAPRVKWLKVPKPPFRFLDFEEAARLADATARTEPDWHAMVVVALNTGMRPGELLALRWDAVDLKAGRIHVRQAMARGVVGTPKNGGLGRSRSTRPRWRR